MDDKLRISVFHGKDTSVKTEKESTYLKICRLLYYTQHVRLRFDKFGVIFLHTIDAYV